MIVNGEWIMNEDAKVLELIEQSLKGVDSSSEVHKDLFINNIRCLINLWKGRKFTEETFKSFKDKNYYNYGRYK